MFREIYDLKKKNSHYFWVLPCTLSLAIVCGYVVLTIGIVTMHKTLINEDVCKHAFYVWFLHSNGGAAVVEYLTFETVHRILTETGFLSQVNADVNNNGVEVMFWRQCNTYRMFGVAEAQV